MLYGGNISQDCAGLGGEKLFLLLRPSADGTRGTGGRFWQYQKQNNVFYFFVPVRSLDILSPFDSLESEYRISRDCYLDTLFRLKMS